MKSLFFRGVLLGHFFLIVYTSVGQTGAIVGKVTDNEGHPVEFVPLSLGQLPDSTQIAAQTSDEQGNYAFRQLPKGKYLIKAQQIGFQPMIVTPIEIEEKEK